MKVIVNGLATEYSDEGKGTAMLFLHGWADNLHTFDAIMPALSSSFRIIRVDLPGFGKSEMPVSPWVLNDYVRFIKDFLTKIDVNTNVLVGHSLGGRIVIKGMSTKELNADKIVLIASAGIAKRRTMRNSILTVLAKAAKFVTTLPPARFWRAELRGKLYAWIGSDYFASGAMRDTFLNIIKEDLVSASSIIRTPSLLIWGSADKTAPLSDGEKLSKIISGANLEIIPNAGHFVHREHPAEVARMIREFI